MTESPSGKPTPDSLMKRKPYAIDDRQTPETPSRNPWKWIPTLYFAEALPYVTVMSISTVMYERMGLSNAEIAFYTSALYLPWVVKPLWSPFIDLAKSKRWWILAMEFLIAAAIAGVAFTLPSAHFLVFTLMFLWMMAFSSATHDIAADGFYMLALDPHEQSLYVGIRSTFYRIATIAGSGLLIMLAGTLETFTRRIAYSWSIAFYVLAAFFIAVTAYHFFHLPRPDCDRTRKAVSARSLWKDIWLTVTSFFRKPQPVAAVLFMLFYRLPEALLIRISNLFLIKPVSEGGLGLSTQEVGFVQGTVGVLGLTLGGIIGGIAASRDGLKKWLWPMVWSITLPDLVYVYLSYFQSTNFLLINAMVFIEQFGYGFGFTAYMLFLLYYSQGEQQTSHYAFCTAFMALSMMLPGAVAGELQEAVGYFHFFLIVMACCLVTVGVTALLKIDPEFGKKEHHGNQAYPTESLVGGRRRLHKNRLVPGSSPSGASAFPYAWTQPSPVGTSRHPGNPANGTASPVGPPSPRTGNGNPYLLLRCGMPAFRLRQDGTGPYRTLPPLHSRSPFRPVGGCTGLMRTRSRHCLHFGHRFQFLPLRRTGHCATCVSVGIHLRGRRQRHSFRQTPDRRLAQRTFRRRTKP